MKQLLADGRAWRRWLPAFILVLMTVTGCCFNDRTSSMDTAKAPLNLKTEYTVNPLGIDASHPMFFWQINDNRRGAKQTAYQILAGSKPGAADLWDTDKVLSADTIQIPWGGAALSSGQKVYWQVRSWDAQDVATAYSKAASFEMGLLNPTDWKGQWISFAQKEHNPNGPALYFRKPFDLPGKVKSARLYITSRGVYIPYLNGQRISEDRLTPGWTEYNIRIRYQTYDVTTQLRQGSNAIGVILGDGWYCGQVGWFGSSKVYGDRPALLAQLQVTLDDGQQVMVCSDGTWQASSDGPLTQQSALMGDSIDARKAWDFSSPTFKPTGWTAVEMQELNGVKLIAQVGPTIQKTDELPVVESWKLENGDWVFDFGQNLVGVVRVKIKGKAGQTISIRHAEMLNGKDDRSIYTTNLRSAKATDTSILAGKGEETFEPQFTLHGFRYIQVTGLTDPTPAKDLFTALVYQSNTPKTGTFSCSYGKLNQLQHNIVWGQKGNFVEVPTDCPQRDERLGWMGDAQVFVRTATFNMDVAAFFNRWLQDVEDAQLSNGAYTDVAPDILTKRNINAWGSGSPAWGDAGVICPWTIYLAYGDKRILERQYSSMCRFIDFLDRRSDNGLHPDCGYGDWLAINSDTNKQLIGTAYSAYSLSLMQKIAAILGKPEDERRFATLHDKFRAAFNREFVTPAGRLTSSSQTAAVLALRFNLLDEPVRSRVATWLGDDITTRGVITTGFVGCNLILPTLSQIGRDDLAWQLLTSEKFPSWLFSVNQGATTIWERWDGWTPDKGFQTAEMNSFNHYAYGSCGQWMYARIGGIEMDENHPGYRRFNINPVLARGLTGGKASLQTLHGLVSVDWKLAGEKFSIKVTVPANTTAYLHLPGKYVEGDVEPSMIRGEHAGRTGVELPAGTYKLNSVLLVTTK